MGTYGLSYGDLWKQSTEAEFPDPAVDFCLEKSPRVEMGPCAEPARSTSRAQLPPRPATSVATLFIFTENVRFALLTHMGPAEILARKTKTANSPQM